MTKGRNSEQIRHRHDLRAEMIAAKGILGTSAELREVALSFDASAKYCEERGELELAARDRRFAAAMRKAADILTEHP